MNALEYARRFIYFWQASPIAGPFDDRKYPLCIDPLLALDNIDTKTTVWYGPTQSIKTVLLTIATAYRLDILRKSLLAIAQTDDDAKDFARIKLNPVLSRIRSLTSTVQNNRHAITLQQWLWPQHELIISGPGENAQESKSVCFLHTDEAHRWNVAYPAAMSALENRMGERWDRHALHATTAADAGTEIDILYHKGRQNEWHLRCIHCDSMIWPLWEETARKEYNGERVFHWKDSQSETEMLDSICIVCPHCAKEIKDEKRNRLEMDIGAQYITKNAGADKSYDSFRWNALCLNWKSWRDLLAKYLKALHSAKLGDFGPYTDWVKKQEVRTNTGEIPDVGGTLKHRNYSVADIKDEGKYRVLSIDVQEGKDGEGFHLWALADEWDKETGNSRRIDYRKLASWADARAMQQELKIPDSNVCVDCGKRSREVFAHCAQYHWLAVKSTDETEFAHQIRGAGQSTVTVRLPYSTTRLENPNIGTSKDRMPVNFHRGHVPTGFAISRLWSKPVIYGLLFALKNGTTPREYGVARDLNPEYERQLHSYSPALIKDKITGFETQKGWRQIRADDHSFVCSAQSLLMAMIQKVYRVEIEEPQPVAA